MRREHVTLWSPSLAAEGDMLAYGHYGRPVVVFPSEGGRGWEYEDNGMIDTLAPLIDSGRIKLYCVDSFDAGSWSAGHLPLEERARQHEHFEQWTIRLGGERHTFATERVTIEPFDLRARPRHALVLDRLAYWYYVPREWLKKAALMNDVYMLKSPFTFQAMEKHAAYCAMIRLGLRVPETWMLPQKKPVDNPRFPYTAQRYNQPFDLDAIAVGSRRARPARVGGSGRCTGIVP